MLVYVSTNSALGYLLPAYLPAFIVLWIWQLFYPGQSETSLQFSFAFSWWLMTPSMFFHVYWLYEFHPLKKTCSCLLPIFWLDGLLFCCWVSGLLTDSGYESSVICLICKYLLPFCRLPLHFVKCFLCSAEVSLLDIILSIFAFIIYDSGVLYMKYLSMPMSYKIFPFFLQQIWWIGFRSMIHLEFIFV